MSWNNWLNAMSSAQTELKSNTLEKMHVLLISSLAIRTYRRERERSHNYFSPITLRAKTYIHSRLIDTMIHTCIYVCLCFHLSFPYYEKASIFHKKHLPHVHRSMYYNNVMCTYMNTLSLFRFRSLWICVCACGLKVATNWNECVGLERNVVFAYFLSDFTVSLAKYGIHM